ncbi:DUF485 domain-containing protein [Cytobacillus purgationiresistens]|uniref:Uncharacterized membrane protein (DUF485 family) n=1 Tax=Cytobacillus purgationiresistens TaxID=863449 RepID=A0ABU0APQ0_9BACI|nr:DUF485 domain-containing protein [Cytobacillus purgationiresistens]MDQ0273266.1 uncharacterized membrane protein (DUF485 family) [Cytobacillus purgationiresistens]
MDNLAKAQNEVKKDYDYEKIAESNEFKSLISAKKRFIVPTVIFFIVFYFTLPILTSFTTILNKPAIGAITWTWVYALAQFVMTWVLCTIYVKKASRYDQEAEAIIENHKRQGDQ